MNGCPQTMGRRNIQEAAMEERTFVQFHSRRQENAYPYWLMYPGIFLGAARKAMLYHYLMPFECGTDGAISETLPAKQAHAAQRYTDQYVRQMSDLQQWQEAQ